MIVARHQLMFTSALAFNPANNSANEVAELNPQSMHKNCEFVSPTNVP